MHNRPHANTNQRPHNRTINAAAAAIGSIDPAVATRRPGDGSLHGVATLHRSRHGMSPLRFLSSQLVTIAPSSAQLSSEFPVDAATGIVFRFFPTCNSLPPWPSIR